MNKPTVLIAGTPPAIRTVQQLLGSEVETICAHSLDEAVERLAAHPDMILCNVRFDESRMFELLKAAKEQPGAQETPFVCFRLAPLPLAWRHCIEAAVLAIGATAFIDLSALERDRGRVAAESALREIVLSHLPH
jgi:CheY-like chemotaxis protein